MDIRTDFIFQIETKYGIRYEYRYDRALEIYEEEGIRMYAYEKSKIKPTKILLAWKQFASFFYCNTPNIAL